jgi:pimeloyl-ACP methyl ester carboxylesterase
MRLHYEVHGDGPPLILLHGFLGSLDNWRSISKRLADSYTVYSLDLRNHGASPHSQAMNYPVMAEDLLEFFDEHDIATVQLLGHSMGGKVAVQFATDNPDRLSKLIVVDIAPRAYPPFQRPMLEALRKLDLQGVKSFGAIDAALAPDVRDETTRRFLLKNIARDTSGFRWKIPLDAIIENYEELTKAVTMKAQFYKPACFIRGGQSEYIQDEDLTLIKSNFPGARIVTIETAGHWVHVDSPDEFLRTLRNFLD